VRAVAGRLLALEIFDLAPLPFYNADLEKQGIPDSVKNFVACIAAADALLIARRNIITPFRARLKMQLTGRRVRRRIHR
jgi:NAD(P)H-dependent FMN reductase